jgi:ABC-type multidrug transport system fused ATPase/permease subunit
MNGPTDLRYNDSHEWIRLDGDTATVGITDYAQKQLGDLVFIGLPEIGTAFEEGADAAVIESVKAANAEWKMLDRWRSMTSTMADSELKMRQFSTLSSNLTQTIQQLSYAGMIAAGAYAINSGALTMGGLIACSIISGRALTPVAQLPSLMVQWQHAKIALKSLNGIMAMPPLPNNFKARAVFSGPSFMSLNCSAT